MGQIWTPNKSVIKPETQKEAMARMAEHLSAEMFIGSIRGMGQMVLKQDKVYPIMEAKFSSAEDFEGVGSLLQALEDLAKDAEQKDTAEGVSGLLLLGLLRLAAKNDWDMGKAALALHRGAKDGSPEGIQTSESPSP